MKNKNHKLEIVLFLSIWQKDSNRPRAPHTAEQDPGFGRWAQGKVLKQGPAKEGTGAEDREDPGVQANGRISDPVNHSLARV